MRIHIETEDYLQHAIYYTRPLQKNFSRINVTTNDMLRKINAPPCISALVLNKKGLKEQVSYELNNLPQSNKIILSSNLCSVHSITSPNPSSPTLLLGFLLLRCYFRPFSSRKFCLQVAIRSSDGPICAEGMFRHFVSFQAT